MANLHTFEINGTAVPAAYRPGYTSGVIWPRPTATDLAGRPVGARGWPKVRLWWDRISVEAYQYWEGLVGAGYMSVPLASVTLVEDGGEDGHATYYAGLLWRIQPLDSSYRVIYNGTEQWREGGAEMWITELGRPL